MDLPGVQTAAELGPLNQSEGSQDEIWWRIEQAKQHFPLGERFLGGWLCDSAIRDMELTGSRFRLAVSELWATTLARYYAKRTGHPKYSRCTPAMTLQFEFTGVSELICRDCLQDGRLAPADCKAVFAQGNEFLLSEVVYASSDRIQMALSVWAGARARHESPMSLILVDARRGRLVDRRGRNWARAFGPASLWVLEDAETRRSNDPFSIYGDENIQRFLDEVGVRSKEMKGARSHDHGIL